MFKIITGDAITELAKLRDAGASFSAVATDPPYCSGGVTINERRRSVKRKYFGNREGDDNWRFDCVQFNDTMDAPALYDFTRAWLRVCYDLLLNSGYVFIFCDWRTIPIFASCLQGAGLQWLGVIPWNKQNARPNPGIFTPICEYVVYGSKNGKSDKHCKGLITASPPKPDERVHPTQKPVSAFETLYTILPDNARAVLDPFCGAGASGVAALRRGLDYVGIDVIQEYANAALARLDNAQALQDLSAAARQTTLINDLEVIQ